MGLDLLSDQVERVMDYDDPNAVASVASVGARRSAFGVSGGRDSSVRASAAIGAAPASASSIWDTNGISPPSGHTGVGFGGQQHTEGPATALQGGTAAALGASTQSHLDAKVEAMFASAKSVVASAVAAKHHQPAARKSHNVLHYHHKPGGAGGSGGRQQGGMAGRLTTTVSRSGGLSV